MKTTLLISLLFIVNLKLYSQDSTYMVEPGVYPAKVIPAAKQLQYPEFREGRIFFSTGKQTDVLLLNYHLLYDAILLIEAKGDTVWLDKTIVEYVQIESDFYFCHLTQGYFRLLTRDEPVKLMLKSIWIVARKGPLHAHWADIESPQKPMSVDHFVFPTEYTWFAKARLYSFLGPMNKIYKPTKQSVMKALPEKKKAIRNYLKQHKIDYSNEGDLRKLVTFCNAL